VWTSGRGGLRRFVAHLLIRLLILGPLPPYAQLTAALFPASLLWPLAALAEEAREPSEKVAAPGEGGGCVLPLTEGAVGASGFWREGKEALRMISFQDPTNPIVIATLTGVGSKLALTDNNLLLSVYQTLINGSEPRGLHSHALQRLLALKACVMSADESACVSNALIPFDGDRHTTLPVRINYRIYPGNEPAQTIKAEIVRGETPVQDVTGSFDGISGSGNWPIGAAVVPGVPYFVQARADEGTPYELRSVRVPLRIDSVTLSWSKERQAFVAHLADGRTLIEDTWDESGSGLEPPINGFDYKNSTRTFTKAVATLGGNGPNLPDDYMLLKINGGDSAIVWEETGSDHLRIDVPSDGLVKTKLKAKAELAALQVRRVTITAEYHPSSSGPALELKDDTVLVMNERLHGHLYNVGAGVIGRGEGLESTVAEIGVGLIPVAGDGAGILAEVINAFDPTTEVSKLNFVLSVLGIATEFTQISGPVGIALDKGVVFIRVGIKRIGNVVSGPLKRLPDVLYVAAKARNWERLAEFAEGSMKLAVVGPQLIKRVAREDADLESLNRLVKKYSDNVLDTHFVEKLTVWDNLYGDADAVRGAVRALADLRDATGAVIRLSDEAAEGAVKFMAKAGADIPVAEREELLKKLLLDRAEQSDAHLKFLRETTDPNVVEGYAKLLRDIPSVCPAP
jgi:hypothetical protein